LPCALSANRRHRAHRPWPHTRSRGTRRTAPESLGAAASQIRGHLGDERGLPLRAPPDLRWADFDRHRLVLVGRGLACTWLRGGSLRTASKKVGARGAALARAIPRVSSVPGAYAPVRAVSVLKGVGVTIVLAQEDCNGYRLCFGQDLGA